MEKLESNLIKFIVGLWIAIISSGIFYYPLLNSTNLPTPMIYPVSLGLGLIVSFFMISYLIKLHGFIFENFKGVIK